MAETIRMRQFYLSVPKDLPQSLLGHIFCFDNMYSLYVSLLQLLRPLGRHQSPCQNNSTHVGQLKLTPPSLDSVFSFASSQETNPSLTEKSWLWFTHLATIWATGLAFPRVWTTGAQSSSQTTERKEKDPVGPHLGSASSQSLPNSFSCPHECSPQGRRGFYSWEKREQEKLHVGWVGAETRRVRSSRLARAL